jgi:hypothetical protein
VITRKTGFVAGAALAAGLAIGFAGSALAANPAASPGYPSMMRGGGMMGGSTYGPGMMNGASFAPGSSFGPGMMVGLSSDQLKRCDEIHDAMHASASPSTSPSPR